MSDDRLPEALAVLGRHGLECTRMDLLSRRMTGRKSRRRAYRAILADGSSLKVRCFESDEAAARLAAVRKHVPPEFAPVVACDGDILLERWIHGGDIPPADAISRAADIGAILGRLHATSFPESGRVVPTQRRADEAIAHLRQLASAGAISSTVGAALEADIRRTDPHESPQTVVHRDYCPENFVVDGGGDLHVIDNEWIDLDAPGVDLARTWSRWPMTDETWRRLVTGYASTASIDPGPLRFWKIVMAAAGAAIRLAAPPEDLMEPIGRLHELATAAHA
jgi:aminoglycoside phosphotransferase (APT) family kinase protein